jgi:hypothetical protein
MAITSCYRTSNFIFMTSVLLGGQISLRNEFRDSAVRACALCVRHEMFWNREMRLLLSGYFMVQRTNRREFLGREFDSQRSLGTDCPSSMSTKIKLKIPCSVVG